ncbi:PX domain-containing protein [Colletotrichum navitas]|uniref:Endosomal/vacuolar adapter protein YPT35 n=1 Tax=Colletotrichum navitas TaxID=681940 RepID=A0AAD8Q9L4_9PEZI|nr:PX domain-containing protein [Colletotrichum navitas]KAK1597507.1 PX domain-containing protein [Colletotrichum navitas]
MESAIESQFRPGHVNGRTKPPSKVAAHGAIEELLSRQNDNETSRGGLFGDDEDDDTESQTGSSVTSPSVTSPPYWLGHHQRSASNMSAESVLPDGAITMHDNEASDVDGRNRACWAKSVEITDYVVVNGSATNIGAFVVWNIRVETLQGSYMNIRKRYSEFDDLRERLVKTFPNFEAAVPPLPPKSVISKFRPRFLDKRRSGLQYFLNCIMLNPEFSSSPVLKDFLFS